METKQEQKIPKSKGTKSSTAPIRVKRETRKKILQELVKANKKEYGRKLRAEDLIALAITLLQPEHITQLQDAALSNADRLEQLYKNYAAKHGSLSKDAFLGKLLAGEMGPSNGAKTQAL
jgi:hypothetical protein